MPSFISSSESEVLAKPRSAAWNKPIAALLAVVSIFLIGIETVTRKLIVGMSRVESRLEREYRAAVAMRPSPQRKAILFAGNSLMDDGVDFIQVRASLGPKWDARRLYVAGTTFWDFYYGLRRLYAEGARYHLVVVFLAPFQLNRDSVRGDYFAQRLMLLSDVLSVARDVNLSRTTTANLTFANISAFYGLRGELRKVLVGRLMPDMPALMKLVTKTPALPFVRDEEIYRDALTHLRRYRELAEQQHTRIYLALAPLPTDKGFAAVKRAGADAGITVVSVPQETTPSEDFPDGLHLNGQGQRAYTAALIPALHRALETSGDATRAP